MKSTLSSVEISNAPVLAVYPFENLTANKDHNIICKSFCIDLITELSRFRHFQIISYQTVTQLKSLQDNNTDTIKLNTDYHIFGSVRILNIDIRINIQLINSKTGKVVWAERMEGNLEDLFELQQQLLTKTVASLQQQVNADMLSHVRRKPKSNLKAYECWIKGMDEIYKGTLKSDLQARKFFKQAAQIDPEYSLAYSGISLSYFNEWSCRLWDRWDKVSIEARNYALKANALDPNDYIALMILGRSYLYSGDWERAEECLRRSIELNPNDAINLAQVGFWMCYLGLAHESEILLNKAILLNPLNIVALNAYGMQISLENGQYQKSIEMSKKVTEDVKWVDFDVFVAAAYYQSGDQSKAIDHWQKYLERYKNEIYNGEGNLESSAYKWYLAINPYKGATHVKEFLNFIYQADRDTWEMIPEEPIQLYSTRFRTEGDFRELRYKGFNTLVKDSKGMKDIETLLSAPGKEYHCSELMGSALAGSGDVQILDQKTIKELQSRILELQNAIRESEEENNLSLSESLQQEYDQLLEYLSGAMGLSGQSRSVGSIAEKARSAVTWRIRSAIKAISKVHPQMGIHLSNTIKTGNFCSYAPEEPIDWEI